MKRKIQRLGLCAAVGIFLTAALAGCVKSGQDMKAQRDTQEQQDIQEQQDTKEQQDDGLKIVATIFPAYDWTREILGEQAKNVELTLLLDNGVDMHSFQPTVDDIIQIGTCDLFLYVGGESDEWVEEVLASAVNPDMKVINLLDTLGEGVKEEEIVEGMEGAHKEHAHGEEEEKENDEHVWLSLRNAKRLCGAIAGALEELDATHADLYRENAETYIKQLDELDEQFQETVAEADKDTLLFADRFPFRYLTDDYGLNYYAAFPGCEAETEASFETITFLAKKVDELDLPCVLTIEGTDQEIAKTVIENTKDRDQEIRSLNSLQSVTAEEIEDGTTYLSVMEENRNVLKTALSGK